jgi:hypothetical protein
MKLIITVTTTLVLLGSLTGCCYQSGYCDPMTGVYNSGYWAPQCGGPLDPFCFSCNGYPSWNSYGQCVDSSQPLCQPSECNDCCDASGHSHPGPISCATTAAPGCSDCSGTGGYQGIQQGYESYPIMNQPTFNQPASPQLAPQSIPQYPNGVIPNSVIPNGPTPVPDPEVPEASGSEKPAANYVPAPYQHSAQTQQSPKHEAARGIKEARRAKWIPATF